MSFPREPRDTVVELFVGGAWVDIGTGGDVYGRQPLQITRGHGDGATAITASRCELTVNNRDGNYNPRNPTGDYYGQLGRNTPIRVSVRTIRDAFSRTVVNGWGSTTTGQVWTLIGAGGSVQASDYQVTGSVATHSVPSVNAYRASYVAQSVYAQRDVDVAVTVSVPVTDITGGSIEPANLMLRVNGTPAYYHIKMAITTTETVTLQLFSLLGNSLAGPVTVPGLTHNAAQPLRIRAVAEGQTVRVKVWPAATTEPYDWHMVAHHSATDPHVAFVPAGGIGIRSGVASGNTNTLPMVYTYTDLQVRVPRFAGEVSSWPQRWSDGTVDAYVTLEAAGLLRRLSQGSASFRSAPYRDLITRSGVDYYCPLEDASLSTAGRPVRGEPAMRLTGAEADESRAWGRGDLAPWLPNVVAREGLTNLETSGIVMPNFTTTWTVSWMMAGGKANNDLLIFGPTTLWRVEFSQAANNIRIHTPTGGITTINNQDRIYDGGPHHISFQTSDIGATCNWTLTADGALIQSGTGVAVNLEPVVLLSFRNLVDNGSLPLAIGHVVVGASFDESALGHRGESAGRRIERLCAEEGIPFSYIGGLDDTVSMGPQYADTFLNIVAECVEADRGELYEPRGVIGLEYRTGKSFYNQDATLALDFAEDHLAPPLEPVDDDQLTRNRVTVSRREGGEYTATQTTGPLSTADPADGGIGVYDTNVTVNVHDDNQLSDQAGWLLHQGTFDGARYPQITVNLARAPIAETSAVANTPMDVNIGDRLTVDNVEDLFIFEPIAQIVRGTVEKIDVVEHTITAICTPETTYQTVQLDDADYGKINTAGSELHQAATASATTWDVATTSGPLWVTAGGEMPIPVTAAGERVSVTAISNELITFVNAGTATHANNANVTPGLPGSAAAGDLLLVYAAIRNHPAGIPSIPAGYTLLHDNVNARLFGKIHTGSESDPTVSFTGGVANATTSAQMAAFRGKFHDINNLAVNANGQFNISAQDVLFTALSVPFDNCLVLYLGWKQDDWTSVTSPGTEIGEPNSTTGDDQGLVWAYTIQTTATAVSGGSFTVTGGAAAISRAGVLALRCDRQTFTVTRAVNQVSKPQSAGTSLVLTRRATAGL